MRPKITEAGQFLVFRAVIIIIRFIGQDIRQISDILSFAAEQNIEGITPYFDFEKAVDSLKWKFLSKPIETSNFGSDFKR